MSKGREQIERLKIIIYGIMIRGTHKEAISELLEDSVSKRGLVKSH